MFIFIDIIMTWTLYTHFVYSSIHYLPLQPLVDFTAVSVKATA